MNSRVTRRGGARYRRARALDDFWVIDRVHCFTEISERNEACLFFPQREKRRLRTYLKKEKEADSFCRLKVTITALWVFCINWHAIP